MHRMNMNHDRGSHQGAQPHPRFRAGGHPGADYMGFLGGPAFGPRGFGGRARKGDVRSAILSLLGEGPTNGYGLIKAIHAKSDAAAARRRRAHRPDVAGAARRVRTHRRGPRPRRGACRRDRRRMDAVPQPVEGAGRPADRRAEAGRRRASGRVRRHHRAARERLGEARRPASRAVPDAGGVGALRRHRSPATPFSDGPVLRQHWRRRGTPATFPRRRPRRGRSARIPAP
jgi:hypothetical protein